jgi:hypothetical protein
MKLTQHLKYPDKKMRTKQIQATFLTMHGGMT